MLIRSHWLACTASSKKHFLQFEWEAVLRVYVLPIHESQKLGLAIPWVIPPGKSIISMTARVGMIYLKHSIVK